ncbi:unnamed protein product [Gemmataceae bacterium]|nr:unnamed protein product [Gemmataceae bacterium]VTT98882.1 unnamed protein product [Gemmataceae bacterium]
MSNHGRRLVGGRAAVRSSGTRPAPPSTPSDESPTRAPSAVAVRPQAGDATHACGCRIRVSELANHRCRRCDKASHRARPRPQPVLSFGGSAVGRLPDGAVKTVRYTAAEGWSGAMTVPGCPVTFAVSGCANEVACCRALHRRYVAWFVSRAGAGEPSDERTA